MGEKGVPVQLDVRFDVRLGPRSVGRGSPVFLGDSRHTLDAKNRVFVPKRFQSVLERDAYGNLVAILTRGQDGCLALFSETGFRRTLERLDTAAISGRDQRNMQRMFFAHTHRVQLDASGRLLVPEKLKALAGIDREVAMIGVVERAEIWASDRWEAFEAENGNNFDELDEVLAQSGRLTPPEA